MIKRFLLLLIIPAHISQGVYAQNEQKRDTLDWQGYYPLEIGNAWEWKTHQPNVWFGGDVDGFDHREIVSDTLINDQQYLVQVAYSINEFEATEERKVVVWRDYLRYDTLRRRIVQFDLVQGGEYGYTCDLSADFNGVGVCYDWLDMGVGGDYASDDHFEVIVGSDYAPYNAVKSFGGLTGGSVFYHGIGSLPTFGDGASGAIEFTYVKVSDAEYGARSVRVGVEKPVQPQELVVEIYPNPVKSRLYLVMSEVPPGIKGRIIDVLGRSAPVQMICEEKRCQLDVSSLRAGVYILEYNGSAQVYGRENFVVSR